MYNYTYTFRTYEVLDGDTLQNIRYYLSNIGTDVGWGMNGYPSLRPLGEIEGIPVPQYEEEIPY